MHVWSDAVNFGILLGLKSMPVLGPIGIEIEGDRLFLFSLFVSDDIGEGLPKAFKNFGRRDFELPPQGHGKRVLEDVLDSLELDPVVHESIVVLDAAIHTAVQKDYLIRIEKGPT